MKTVKKYFWENFLEFSFPAAEYIAYYVMKWNFVSVCVYRNVWNAGEEKLFMFSSSSDSLQKYGDKIVLSSE